ncbi:Stk1 family PASTA domain-containing Ser/Thr kinase [Desulfosporosinus sp. BICA1-9]|uniref:Stk1 family PASTA domain-containing Ser/Thr kinase n=1 Tax=Desulfosporosinus sp. BICA1-9 TaxID=1531958 RepID=UPI00054B189F|nr:Stk1 family PASTA domain-containing Ser/Thr kinase [Desulfosporosinus sp. BICA1-9]KJS48695.1 MAG: serine/threonine protein kinase [Peptococcaceae bacterium BRH_c23]KJS90483.1 MAG: serine/threonine protein kinase [Desulfosporosinus sp. BICA1-9]HBW38433.1 Stk1 family PASTA domain-containing Ser/Thr kinase [Desulfosporosinus sp.]
MSKIFGGRYEVLERIGAGGMAIVYKAKDVLLNRVVTIKVLREQFVTDEDFIRRFRREAQSAASLSHPNIVSIYDVGKDGDTEYIVMEYVEGRNLKEIIREYAPLSTDQSINLARQITGAIQNAHEHHIIHRDIKPHNILVTADGHTKVTDFGIARAVSSATVTHTGDIVGSVHYLSPEQAKGIQSNEQSDIYSLGIVLYELLTGKVPYDGETPIAIALKHLQQLPVPPSKLNPRIGREFEAVIMRAISKSPEQRYLAAKDLLEDLNHIQNRRPITRLEAFQGDDSEATQTHKGMVQVLAPIGVKDSIPAKSKNKQRRLWIIGGLVLLFSLLSGVLWLKSIFAVPPTTVPDLVGKTVPVAEDYINKAKLSLSPEPTFQFSDQVEKDRIIDQDPKAGLSVKEGRAVKIVVSKGVDIAEFPDVKIGQMSKDNAVFLIKNAGFTGKITFESKPDANVPKDAVIDQNPAPKASWPKNGEIHLTISTGPQLVSINMPSVIGKTSAEAQTILVEQNRLILKIETEDSTTFPIDVVMRTLPNPGEAVQQGTEVTIVVSRGPGPLAQGIGALASKNPVSIAQVSGIHSKEW